MFNQHQDIGNLRTAMVSLEEEMTINGNLQAAHEDIELDEPISGLSAIFRLRAGVERLFITDINDPAGSARGASQIVVMHDAISTEADHFNHVPGGANVLYLDGHVEFVQWTGNLYVGEFPVNLGALTLHNVGEGIVPVPDG
jgi:prepilin-type processing-associated H-X9-DG protein